MGMGSPPSTFTYTLPGFSSNATGCFPACVWFPSLEAWRPRPQLLVHIAVLLHLLCTEKGKQP